MEATRTALGAATVFVTAGLLSFFLSPEELGVIIQDGHVHSHDQEYYHEEEDTQDYYYTTPEPVYTPETVATPANYVPAYVPSSKPNRPNKPGKELQKLANQIDIPIDVLVIGLGMALSFGALALLYIVAKESEGVDEEAYFYNASAKGIDPYQLHLELGRLAVKDGQVMIVPGKQALSLQQDDSQPETPVSQAFNYKTETPQGPANNNKVARSFAQRGEGRNVDSLLGSLSSFGLANANPDTDYEDTPDTTPSSAVPFYQKSGSAPHRIEESDQVITVRAIPTTFAGHTAVVTGVYTNPGLTELFSVSLDKSLRIWDKQTRQVLHTVANHHTGAINGMAVDGERVYTAGEDGIVHVWSWLNGSSVGKLVGHKGAVKAVQVDGQFVYTSSADLSVKIWDKNTLTEKMSLTLPEIKTAVNALYVTDQYIVTAAGNSIFIWTKQGQPFYKWPAHHQDITSLVVLDGTIYSGSVDSFVRVWNLRGQLVSSYINDSPQVVLSVDGDDTFLYALYQDGSVRAWDRSTEGSYVELAPAGSKIAGGSVFADQFNVYVAAGNVVSAYNKPSLSNGYVQDTTDA
jgi:WD40 repeat protein